MIPDMDKPIDHDARMKVARDVSRWNLGDPSWADEIVAAYLYPQDADTGDDDDDDDGDE